MTTTEQHVRIANRLYECRRQLRRLLGDKYQSQAAKWMDLVRQIGQGKGFDELKTCMFLLKDDALSPDGMAQMWICAATVELMEPDEGTPQ